MTKKIILLLIVILFTIPLFCFGATNVYQDYNWYSADPTTYIKTIYDNHNLHCIKYFINVEDTSFKEEIANHIVTYNQNYYLECKNNGYRIYLLWNDNPSNWINSSVSLSYNNSWVTCPTTMGEMNYNTYYDVYFNTSTFKYAFLKNTSGGTVFVPECLIGYYNQDLYNYLDVLLNGTDTQQIVEVLNSVDEHIEESNSQLQQLNQWMSNEDDSDIQYGVNTPSTDGSSVDNVFNGIFMRFYNAFNGVALSGVNFPIPFSGGKSVYVRPDFTYNIINKTGLGNALRGLLSSVWYFLVGMYIVKDIQKLYQDIKSGDIMTKTDTNVKADML